MLAADHQHAQKLGECLESLSFVKKVLPVHTNILFFEFNDGCDAFDLVAKLEKENIKTLGLCQKPNAHGYALGFHAPDVGKND